MSDQSSDSTSESISETEMPSSSDSSSESQSESTSTSDSTSESETPTDPAGDDGDNPPSLLLPIDDTNPMVKHAKIELAKAKADDTTTGSYLQAVQGFANLQLSQINDVPAITRLLNLENLSPITTDPSEWTQITDVLWANTRNNKVFSQDGGKTYVDMSELPLHTSVTAATVAS